MLLLSGLYDWQKHAAGKQSYYVTSVANSLLPFAGIWNASPAALVRLSSNRHARVLETDIVHTFGCG
jgi:putative SOS response-associated peptidase YedK